MNDGIIKNDGTSRFIRSVSDFKVKYPTYDAFVEALIAGNLPVDVLFNENGWSQKPDFLNKASLLKDATAALFAGLPENPVPDEVFQILSKAALIGEDGSITMPNGDASPSVKIEIGKYIGTGKYGSSNISSLSFSGDVLILILCGYGTSLDVSMAIVKGTTECHNGVSGPQFQFYGITWNGNRVSWYGRSEGNQANYKGKNYFYAGVILK